MKFEITLKDNQTEELFTKVVKGEVIEDALMSAITETRHLDVVAIAIRQL